MSDERFAVQRTQITRVGRLRTALMLTDLVGYSRRMHADEAGAVRELRAHYELVRKELEAHGGREVKTIGDAFLAEFPIADDALRCAVAIQEAMGRSFGGAEPLQVRIGLHVAEVEAIGPDVIGDGVNILSRIEPLAVPGGICASREFLDACSGRPVPFAPMGPVEVKNISSPIELFAWPAPTGRDAESTAADPAEADPQPTRLARGPRSVSSLPAAREPERADEARTVLHRSLEEVPVAPPPGRSARPLSRSSGIFSPPSEEPFAQTSTVVVTQAEPLLTEVPALRGQQPTLDAPPSEDGTATGPRPDARGYQATSALEEPTDLGLPEVRIPPQRRPRTPLIIVGSVAGVAVALTLVVIGWMVGHAARRGNAAASTETTLVQVPPKPAPAPAPAPVAAPAPAPAPAPPPPAPVVHRAPEPPREPTLEELVAHARHEVAADHHLKPRRRRQLLGDLKRLEGKWKRGRGKARTRAEKALRSYLRRHHLP